MVVWIGMPVSESVHIVVLSGAGISAESGLGVFRGPGGLWEGRSVYEVATPEAWEEDPEQVLRFYNMRRQQVREAQPNAAHRALVELERTFRVTIVTQNVDDLHERAGSSEVLHLHGEIMKARSSVDAALLVDLGTRDIQMGDTCERGGQLRPHVVWFGEPVPEIMSAAEIAATADGFLVIGTSLTVYPAAGLLQDVPAHAPIYLVNPDPPPFELGPRVQLIQETACKGVPALVQKLSHDGGFTR
jgi:NAD-dependent deacetylase